MRIVVFVLTLLFSTLQIGQAGPETFTVQAGTSWETKGCIADSGLEGPVAMILGGVHGNEPAGAVAAERVCSLVPLRGKIIVVPRINPLGLAKNVRYLSEIGDMNRVYPPILLMERYKIAILIDLHEARTFHRLDKTSLGQTLLFADNSISATLAMDAVDSVNKGISEGVKKFALVGHPIPESSAWYAGKYFGIAAFTVETSSKQALEERVGQHMAMVHALLSAGGWLEQ